MKHITKTQTSFYLSTFIIALATLILGWRKRWVSDDGLIIQRVVHQILAGNGPVFNVGERVEVNTSVLWQYVLVAASFMSGLDISQVVLPISVACAVAAVVVACVTSRRLFGHDAGVFVPFGMVVFLLPSQSHDFLTSGLEWSFGYLYLAVLMYCVVRCVQDKEPWMLYVAGVVCGLSWLVRPELVLYGGVLGFIVLIVAGRDLWKVLGVSVIIPGLYQVFRMGFYGQMVPNTAVAKGAFDPHVGVGVGYVVSFLNMWLLWVPVAMVVGVGVVLGVRRVVGDGVGMNVGYIVVAVLVVSMMHVAYIIAIGGDFMAGRMLLFPLFVACAVVAVVPVTSLKHGLCVGVVWTWMLGCVVADVGYDTSAERQRYLVDGSQIVVDEKDFWQWTSDNDTFHDVNGYRNNVIFEKFDAAAAQGPGVVLQKIGESETVWQNKTVPLYDWYHIPSCGSDSLTVYAVNLGVTGHRVPLDVRVIDPLGLANPLAARAKIREDFRPGHGRVFPVPWQVGDSSACVDADSNEGLFRQYIAGDEKVVALRESYAGELTWERFWDNVIFALKGDGVDLSVLQK